MSNAIIVETLDWPISRCKGKNLDTWEFVEEVKGPYEYAMARAAELQGPIDAEWQYRIWDCRERHEPIQLTAVSSATLIPGATYLDLAHAPKVKFTILCPACLKASVVQVDCSVMVFDVIALRCPCGTQTDVSGRGRNEEAKGEKSPPEKAI